MIGGVALEFHQRTFDFLGRKAVVSDALVAALDEREKACGKPIPPSVREWYSIEGALALYEGPDYPRALGELAAPWLRQLVVIDSEGALPRFRYEQESRDLVAESLLHVMSENQGVCDWAVRLNGSFDPEVVVTANERKLDWLPCVNSFSAFVLARVWDFQPNGRGQRCLGLQADTRALTDSDLELLRRNFDEVAATRWLGGATTYRFFSDAGSMRVWTEHGTGWVFRAPSAEKLYELVASVWRACGDLNAKFSAHGEESIRALDRIEAELLRKK